MAETTSIQALKQQKLLLQMEYYSEKEEFRRQTEAIGMQRKVKRGDAWLPLRIGKSAYNSLNQLTLEVFRTQDGDIEHNFEFGRPVVFFKTASTGGKGGLRYFNFTATVSYVDGDRMVVTVPDNAPILELQSSTESIGCQLYFDETSYRTMFDALDRAINAKHGRLAYLRELFYSKQKAETFSFSPMRFPWLNPTQEKAVNEVLRAKDVMVVHGPPGTGKTTTLVEAINETLMRESQVMVCAQSNMAVDWISEKLVDRGINVPHIYSAVYNNFSEGRMRLLGYVLNDKMKLLWEHGTAYVGLTEEEMRRFNFKQGDSEGFVNYPLSIRGINLSAMFIETHRDIRVSLRSRGDVDVNVFARRYFGGGGHRNAAGGKSFVTMEETIRHFERSVREYFGELPPPATDNGDTDNGSPSQVE